MPNPSEWLVLALERQARVVERLAPRVSPGGRVSHAQLAHLLDGLGVFVLLMLGTLIQATVIWALLAIPMTLCVLLLLADRERRAGESPTPLAQRPRAVRAQERRAQTMPAGIRSRGL